MALEEPAAFRIHPETTDSSKMLPSYAITLQEMNILTFSTSHNSPGCEQYLKVSSLGFIVHRIVFLAPNVPVNQS